MNLTTSPFAPGRKVLITAALPYANGNLHVGHIAGAYLPSDIFARYLRCQGVAVRTVCGSDDHGVAMVLAGLKEGLTPAAVSKKYHDNQQKDLEGLGIRFDVYGSTSENKFHVGLCQDFFKKIEAKGFFKKKTTTQYFDPKSQAFLPDRFVKGICAHCNAKDQSGDQCEQCGRELDVATLKEVRSVATGDEVVLKETVHWFINLSEFEGKVREWLDRAVLRDHTKHYVKSLLGQGLVERSMTRDLAWGVPVPLNDPDAQNKVLYVWFDAPIGYISNTMQLCELLDKDPRAALEWWSDNETDVFHFIGEDNTIFHTIIWIAMLEAVGEYSLPKGVIVNHFLNLQKPGKEAEKMSKSRGTALWIKDYLSEGNSPDLLRYSLTMTAPEESRSVFNPDDLVNRNNGELGGALGNLYQRIIQFTRTKLTPEVPSFNPSLVRPIDVEFSKALQSCHVAITEDLNAFRFKEALMKIMEFARACNRYVDESAPWKSIKTDGELTRVTLGHVFNALKFLGVVLAPFLPDTADKIAKMLTLSDEERQWGNAATGLPAGRALPEPQILFPRMDPKVGR